MDNGIFAVWMSIVYGSFVSLFCSDFPGKSNGSYLNGIDSHRIKGEIRRTDFFHFYDRFFFVKYSDDHSVISFIRSMEDRRGSFFVVDNIRFIESKAKNYKSEGKDMIFFDFCDITTLYVILFTFD